MKSTAPTDKVSKISIALPLALLAFLSAMLAMKAGLVSLEAADPRVSVPETISIDPRPFHYRDAAEYFRNGIAVDAPVEKTTIGETLHIMKFQVTRAEYRNCVDEAFCTPAEEPEGAVSDDMPLTGVSYDDALRYANWLSHKTGSQWSLPTDMELAYAADDRFPDDALGVDPEDRNPAIRWLADYEREARRSASVDPRPQPKGAFGVSRTGLVDFGGNIWEWTSTCNRRIDLDQGSISENAPDRNCGILIASGKHRSPMSSFVRNPKGGGCSVGAPPDNLGFRLVRHATLVEHVRDYAKSAAAKIVRWREADSHMETSANEG